MALCPRLRHVFQYEQDTYRVLSHVETFTATETAAASHIRGEQMAKVVVFRGEDGDFLMAVLPASTWADVAAMAAATGRPTLRLATEAELAPLFPDCEAGAMPPFGKPYGLPLYIDPCLTRGGDIAFLAGNHHELVVMDYFDYQRLARPFVSQRCLHRARFQAAG